MTLTTNEEFAKRMVLLARPAEQFRPTATYDPDGDCVEFIAKPDPFYAERIDDLVTVYYSQETGELIGALLNRTWDRFWPWRCCIFLNRRELWIDL